jgi:hypothetical protein
MLKSIQEGRTELSKKTTKGKWDHIDTHKDDDSYDHITATEEKHINDRPPNFYGKRDGGFSLVRCFFCGDDRGTENYMIGSTVLYWGGGDWGVHRWEGTP